MATTKNNWSTDRISNTVISKLIAYDPDYPWHLYIGDSSEKQFEQTLPRLITSQHKAINININNPDCPDCPIEFEIEKPGTDDQEPDITFNADDITFKVYFN